MKKYKIWVGFIAVIVCALLFGSSKNEVGAAKCDKNKARSYYEVKMNTNAEEGYIELTAKHGSFDISFQYGMEGSYQLNAGTPLRIPFDKNADLEVHGLATLTQGDDACSVDLTQDSFTYDFHAQASPPNQLVDNFYYNDASTCGKFRSDAEALGGEGVSFMQQALSYCYSPQVTVNYNRSDLETMIKNATAAWSAKQAANSMPQGDLTISDDFEIVDSTTISSTLKCDAWSKEKNVKQYAYSETVISNDVCHTDCKEELTVIYDPPVSVKAGLCFTYTVEVKSKVTCSTTVTGSPPTMPTVCEPSPVCNNLGATWEHQGGPNDNFEDCIQDCDNGKYSQSCINKCYKKVYGASTTTRKMLSYQDKLAAEKMANCGSYRNSSGSLNYGSIRDEVLENGDGEYYWDGNVIRWRAGSCYWDRLARYYFKSSNYAQRVVYGTNGQWSGNPYAYVDSTLAHTNGYYIDGGGFYRANNCGENCYFTGCSKGDALNPKDAVEQYEQQLEAYETAIAECSSYAKCEEKTSTFTMSVLPSNDDDWVEYKATNRPSQNGSAAPSGDSIIQDQSGECYGDTDAEGNDYRTKMNFPGVWINNKNGEVVTERPPRDEEIFYKNKPNEYCTPLNSKNVNEKWWMWDRGLTDYSDSERANIEHNLTYNIKASVKNFGRFDWNLNINCFYGLYNGEIDDEGVGDGTGNDGDNPSGNGKDPEINNPNCDIGDDNCMTTDITNYRYKAAALDDLFVGDKSTTNPSATGRETGWNWSCDATDMTDSSYPVTPTALITDIQSKGDDIFSDDSRYLDYSITLTPETINRIKQINRTQKNFLNFTGSSASGKDGTPKRSVYRSSLLDQLGSSVVTTRYTSAIGCNNQEGGSCVTSSMVTPDACVTSYMSLLK